MTESLILNSSATTDGASPHARIGGTEPLMEVSSLVRRYVTTSEVSSPGQFEDTPTLDVVTQTCSCTDDGREEDRRNAETYQERGFDPRQSAAGDSGRYWRLMAFQRCERKRQ